MWEEGGSREEDRPTKPLPGHQEVSRDHLAPGPLGPAHPGHSPCPLRLHLPRDGLLTAFRDKQPGL